ncbi:MAG: addiction module protein [Verrucomicrobiales bacterium]|nr:addiction module protein [Verrucomicrobiales bacterium]
MSDLTQLRELPVAERIQLVEDLWDTIIEEPESVRLTPGQTAELDRRLDRLAKSPDEGIEWETLRSRIQNSL